MNKSDDALGTSKGLLQNFGCIERFNVLIRKIFKQNFQFSMSKGIRNVPNIERMLKHPS